MARANVRGTHPEPHRLGALIREQRDEILARWERGARALPHGLELDRPRLVDHIPELLDRIASMADERGRDTRPELGKTISGQHAIARLEEGFDLVEVIDEFGVLREVLREVLRDSSEQFGFDELAILDRALHTAVKDSIERYTDVRERTLQGFDRIGLAALESRSLDDLLRRLLRVLHETTPSIETSSIYLREGDVLRIRAAVGLDRETEEGVATRIGEGFAGRIAARAEAMTVHHPKPEHLRSPLLANARLRVIHGVPIFDGTAVIGVALIASSTAEAFSRQDRRIFAAMVARASAAILQHVLREQAQRTAQQLAESERQLRALADNIPQLVWMADARGDVRWFNAGWYEYTGLTPDDMKGAWKPRVHHPEYFARVERQWEEAIAAGTPWEDVIALRGRDGRYRWFLSRAVPIRDAAGNLERWFGTNTDVTARRFIDNATKLLNSSLEYRETLERLARLTVPDLADWCIVDLLEHGKLEHVAIVHSDETKLELAHEYVRANAPDLQRDPGTHEVMRTGLARIAADITDDMLASGAQNAEHLRLLRALGFKSWIGAPLIARGQTFGVIHLVMSESGRRYTAADVEVAAELGQRAGVAVDNARLYRDAHEAIGIRDDVLAIVSHDLRNPLSAIDLAATLLMQRHSSDALDRKHIGTIRRSSDRMVHLINDLLDMASINVGRFSIKPVPLDAGDVLREALDINEPLANERGITLVRECDIDGALLDADRDRLIQVFANILGNAIKFCKPGDVVSVRAVRAGGHVRISITDTGPGIALAELPHIFEPYWSGRSGKKTGTGLGLFITKAIVEAHGGAIAIASEEGKGATFEVTLPSRA
jgi:PAS domain S-box-containing protein